jgi:hypothetical protein
VGERERGGGSDRAIERGGERERGEFSIFGLFVCLGGNV